MVQGAKEAGADVETIDLRDYSMPAFDEDIEKQGAPESALKLKEKLREAKGILICTPEYNHSVSYTHLDVYKRQVFIKSFRIKQLDICRY